MRFPEKISEAKAHSHAPYSVWYVRHSWPTLTKSIHSYQMKTLTIALQSPEACAKDVRTVCCFSSMDTPPVPYPLQQDGVCPRIPGGTRARPVCPSHHWTSNTLKHLTVSLHAYEACRPHLCTYRPLHSEYLHLVVEGDGHPVPVS
jgi:hypothetical protein